MAPRDPRLRPYRAALWVVYFVVIVVPIALLVTSVVRHLRGPHRADGAAPLPTRAAARVCAQELEALNADQNHHAWSFLPEAGRQDALARFHRWSQDFEQRVDDLSERCHLDGGGAGEGFKGRAEIARARDAVLSLHRTYRAQANRFAQEGADLAAAAEKALAEAKDAARQP